MILEQTVRKASHILKNKGINSFELDAELIMSSIIGLNREVLITNGHIKVPKKIKSEYDKAIRRRINNEPIAYILGKKEFWSRSFIVNKSTLIPRPETELLLYKVIDFLKNKTINILDVGTGSGCILLSLLKELKDSRGTGIDISSEAIKIARKNSKKFNLNNRANFKVFDIRKFNTGKYDLIMSNPPYIPSRELKNLSDDIKKYEPQIALNGGNNGLILIESVIRKSYCLLKKNGLFAIEVGYGQYKKVSNLLRSQGFREIHKEFDYNRNVRCIISTKVDFFKFLK